jgi:hypothetical protein
VKIEALKTPGKSLSLREEMKNRKDREVFLQPTPYPKCLFLRKDPVLIYETALEQITNVKLVTLLDGHIAILKTK